MRKVFPWLFLLSLCKLSPAMASDITNQTVLPDIFRVYFNENTGFSHKPFRGAKLKKIPTNNEFTKNPGCYVSCLSKNKKGSIYSIDQHVHLIGQIRVEGEYHDGFCQPKGHEDQDLRISKVFKEKCEESFPERCEKANCWANGKLHRWY